MMDVNVTMSMMPKAQPRCAGAELNLGDSVLVEVEKDSFITVPGKGGHSSLLPQETVCPKRRGSAEGVL